MDKERLLRLIREYGEGPERDGKLSAHVLRINAKRRVRLYKEIEKIIRGG